jgi:hypothetical protein
MQLLFQVSALSAFKNDWQLSCNETATRCIIAEQPSIVMCTHAAV